MTGIPREMLQDTLIDVMCENDRLRAENSELKRQLQEAKEFLAAIHMLEIDDATQITDGFGNVYPKYCEGCNAPNEIVRPGDCRCSRRCYVTSDGRA